MTRRPILTLLLTLAVLTLIPAGAAARGRQEQPAEPTEVFPTETESRGETLPTDPQLTIGRLDNGLTYYIRRNPEPENRVFLRLVVNAGSILETESELGLAHFVEHAAFLGTKDFTHDQIVAYLESLGMRFGPDVNAYTGFDETVYMLQIPADDPEKIERGVHILQQWAHAVSFDPQRVETERGVILEEWRVGRGAEQRLRDLQFPILFRDSRYAERLPIGEPEVFMQASPEDLRAFYERWYRPDLMSVIAVGDFDPARMEELLQSYFADIPPHEEPQERPLYPISQHDETLFAPFSDPEAGHSRVTVYTKHPPRQLQTENDYLETLRHRLFAVIMNERFADISRSADAPFLAAGAAQGNLVRTASGTMLQAVTEEDRIAEGFEAILVEAVRARSHGFSESELERARQRLLRSMQTAYNERNTTPSGQYAAEYTRHFLENEAVPGIAYEWELTRRLLPAITVEEINTVADSYLSPENRVVTVSAAETENLQMPDESLLSAILGDVLDRDIPPLESAEYLDQLISDLPTPGTIRSQEHHQDVEVTEWTLDNGVTVLLRPTDFRSDEVRLHAFQRGGLSLAEDQDYHAALLAAPLAEQSGVAHLNRTQLDQLLSGQRVSLSPFIHDYSHGFTGSSSSADIETLLQLVHAYAVSPRFDRDSYNFLMRQLRASLDRRRDQPDAVFADRLQELTAAGDIRRLPLQTDDLVKADYDSAVSQYLKRFSDLSGLTVILVGNLDLEELEPLITQYLATLPVGGELQEAVPRSGSLPRGRIQDQLRFGQEDSSRAALVFTGEFSAAPEIDYARAALADALRIHLREVIREGEGGTYGVQVSSGSEKFPFGRYRYTIGFNTDPQRVEHLTQRVHDEIQLIREDGPATDIVQRVQETHRRDHESNLRSNGWWLSRLGSARFHNEPLRSILERPDYIESLSAETIQQAARQLLATDEYIQLIMYPRADTQPE
ncbi:M16 family metallopeptidase [Spirochaeta africana]|uniref:Putative Zn-dependent peptidase n=1 Tax=Spirochaeta africana (strain ATCC 700263 / DSM 8902 / Z-7692) TaxID=889378 RepID=H9UM74_SPIAZ|nr:M16 family metallopeptidase [Spirochaeta africana]AFG38617.1 putative Zn-dependent peptidase [Spirochaeta africana DSM 8902]